MEYLEMLVLISLVLLFLSPLYYFDIITLETIILVGSTFWFQLFSIFSLTFTAFYFHYFFRWLDLSIAYLLTGMFDHWFMRKITAPVTIISKQFVRPDLNKFPINRARIGHITRVTPLEQWLTHHPIDYTFFYDYELSPDKVKKALEVLIAKVPIIGGVWRKIDKTTLGIDHTDPKVEFLVGKCDITPSVNDEDFGKQNWYGKFMNGINHKFPYPEGEAVFKISIIHYPAGPLEKDAKNVKIEFDSDGKKKYHTLMAIGCSHALTDGEGFFTLMRGFASEMRGEEWDVPEFDRKLLQLDDNEVEHFKPDATVLGKHFDYNTRPTPWLSNAIWPSRRWVVKSWKFTKPDIAALKKLALQGKCGDKLKQMRLSTNDVIVALFWKLRATLDRDYEFSHPVICSLALNTRTWMPERFPSNYFGNALAFLLLAKSRQDLISADFSECCLFVRTAVSALKKEEFERDCHLYPWIFRRTPEGLDTLHRYHTRWCVGGFGYDHGRYLMDRDLLVSNLTKLNTLQCDMGNGHPCRVRFNFQDEANQMGYLFKLDESLSEIEYFGAVPEEDLKFYDSIDVTKADQLDFDKINQKWARETKRRLSTYPMKRMPSINIGALWDGRKDTKVWNW